MVETAHSGEPASTGDERIPDYVHEERGPTHRWTHRDTGLSVEIHETTGQRDPFDAVVFAYRAVARDSVTGEVSEYIFGPECGGSLPRKSEAVRAARGWMASRPDGTLAGAD